MAETDVDDWADIVAVAAGDDHTIGVKSDGTVRVANDIYYGQPSVSEWDNIVAVAADHLHVVGLKSDGTILIAGEAEPFPHVVPGWSDIVAVAAGTQLTVGLRSDGTVLAAGTDAGDAIKVDGWSRQELSTKATAAAQDDMRARLTDLHGDRGRGAATVSSRSLGCAAAGFHEQSSERCRDLRVATEFPLSGIGRAVPAATSA